MVERTSFTTPDGHKYYIVDRDNVFYPGHAPSGINIPLFVDERGLVCTPSRVCAFAAGYAREDAVYKLLTSTTVSEDVRRPVPVPPLKEVLMGARERFPDAAFLFGRARLEVMVYCQAMMASAGKARNEGLVKLFEFLMGCAREASKGIVHQMDDSSQQEVVEGFLRICGEDFGLPSAPPNYLFRDDSELAQVISHRSTNKVLAGPEDAGVKRREEEASPVHETKGGDGTEEFISMLGYGAWVPPGFPDEFDGALGDWVIEYYKMILDHNRNTRKERLGKLIPNIPSAVQGIAKDLGLVDQEGNPTNLGKFVLYRDAGGTFFYHKKLMPAVLYTATVYKSMCPESYVHDVAGFIVKMNKGIEEAPTTAVLP